MSLAHPQYKCNTKPLYSRGLLCLLSAALFSLPGSGCSPDSDNLVDLHHKLATITVTSGDDQTARAGEQLPDPIILRVVNDQDTPLSGAAVTFEVISGGGTVDSSSVETDADGNASAYWTVGFGDNDMKVSLAGSGYEATPCQVHAVGSGRYTRPEQLQDDLKAGHINDSGMDLLEINDALDRIYADDASFWFSMIVVKDGILVLEEYPNSTRDRLNSVASVTKSVTSSLIGIALDSGSIESVDEPMFGFFPEYAHLRNEVKDRILLRHVLSMTPGFEWNELDVPYTDPANDLIVAIISGNIIEYTLSKPITDEPGTRWYYNSGNSQLLAGILKRATGHHADLFAAEHLFGPLGIAQYEWIQTSSGFPDAYGGLRLRTRDMAKFGIMYSHGGVWNGRQVVPKELVDESTSAQEPEGGYGYQWWLATIYGYDWYTAFGYGGQRILVIPELDLVLVNTMLLPGTEDYAELERRQVIENSVSLKVMRAAINDEGELFDVPSSLQEDIFMDALDPSPF